MSFSEIFKKSFLDGFANTEITLNHIIIVMISTCLIALYIFFIYRVMVRNTFYSKSFNISIAAIAVITASIILTVQSSIVISLGMVGALSIVRFRTAIKDPMDLVFLFWSISVGIICGAGMVEIAICTSLVLTAGIFLLNQMPIARAPRILIVNTRNRKLEKDIMAIVKKYCKPYQVKSRTITPDKLDMVIEVRVREEDKLVDDIASLEGIGTVSLLNHDGEVTF